MSSSKQLRQNVNQHRVKNRKSKKMDSNIAKATKIVIDKLSRKYPSLHFEHVNRVLLTSLIDQLKRQFPKFAAEFTTVHRSSFIKPDGGFLYATNAHGEKRLILVSEVKRQGTNDERQKEGLPAQARGNAIERLGKNVIGIRTMFKSEGILPFVCFGNGHDFKEESSIVDRVRTINEFFPLNRIFVVKQYTPFEPCSMFFRYQPWSVPEMVEIMMTIADQAIKYRFI